MNPKLILVVSYFANVDAVVVKRGADRLDDPDSVDAYKTLIRDSVRSQHGQSAKVNFHVYTEQIDDIDELPDNIEEFVVDIIETREYKVRTTVTVKAVDWAAARYKAEENYENLEYDDDIKGDFDYDDVEEVSVEFEVS